MPMLAIVGVFDSVPIQAQQSNDALSIHVDYPSRYRYQSSGTMTIHIQNKTQAMIPVLTVTISRTYMDQFSELQFFPDVSQISPENYIIELTDIPPDASESIRIDLLASNYGLHTGFIQATTEDLEPLRVSINSFTFP